MATKPTTKKPAAKPLAANLDLWNKVCVTDPNFTKWAETRGGFTSINATWQAWQATELWGPYGDKWGVRGLEYQFIGPADHPAGVTLTAVFFSPVTSFEIASDMPYKPNDDCFKKLLTDITTKALSKLGFSADIFLGLWGDNRYVEAAGSVYQAHRAAQTAAAPPPTVAQPPGEQAPPAPAEGAAEPPPGDPNAPPPEHPGTVSAGPFTGTFNLLGLENAVVSRLFLDEKRLLHSFLPNEESTNAARAKIIELVKLKMSDDDTLTVEEKISGPVAEQFYTTIKSQILDSIAARQQ